MRDDSPGKDQPVSAAVPDRAPSAESADPGSILASLGCIAYSWEIASGRLRFAGDIAKVLPGDWGHGFETVARIEESMSVAQPGMRRAALFGDERMDDGSGVPYALMYRLQSADGRGYLVEESGRWFASLPGSPLLARGIIKARPLSPDQQRGDERPAGRPGHRILGRGALRRVLERATEESRRTRRSFGVIAVVAAFGHIAGEEPELAYDGGEGFATRLGNVMRRGDTLVRIDDQTSLCVLNACDEAQLSIALKRLSAALEQPVAGTTQPEMVGAVAGAVWGGAHADSDKLVAAVIDQARAELSGVERVDEARPEPGAPMTEQGLPWAAEILAALNERRLTLACQPIVRAGSRQLAFHEGLLRLRNHAGRLLPASVFIETSETIGLVTLLDQRAIELAAAELSAHPDLRLSINASALSLADPEWLATLKSHAAACDAFADRLLIEVTETAALADIDRTAALLADVRDLGIAIAIDDFGSGHTSFRTLRRLPIEIVKLDGALVQDVDRSSDGRFFIRTLVELAHHLGCKVVAEWVENEACARIVEDLGVDYLQGRHLGAPQLLGISEDEPARLTA